MRQFRIAGMGVAQPVGRFDQRDAAADAESFCCRTPRQRRILQTIYRQSAVRHRATVLSHDPAQTSAHPARVSAFYPPPMRGADRGPTMATRMDAYADRALPLAQRAAQFALHDAAVAPQDVTQLVTVSCTGFSAPGIDAQLVDALGLERDVQRTMIGFMGCHGAINALRVADGLARQPGTGHVLACCIELCTLHFQYGWDAQRVVANALFADGAGAFVGRHAPAIRDEGADDNAFRLLSTGSCLLPGSRDAMTWSIGDHGFEMTLSPRVPELIARHLPTWLACWLAQHELTVAGVGSWAVHPGGPRVLDAVERGLALPCGAVDVSRRVLAECGNMSSATLLFILERLRRADAPRPCVALAFGPGLVIEAALLV